MMDRVKSYIERHEDVLITIGIIILIDQFIFAGAFREKLKGLVDSMINKVTSKLGETNERTDG